MIAYRAGVPPPEATGMALRLDDPTVKIGGREKNELVISYKLPVRPKDVNKNPTENSHLAAVPVSVLLFGEKEGIYIFNLNAPVDKLIDAPEGKYGSGAFSVDVGALPELSPLEQEAFTYAFSWEFMAGPQVIIIGEKRKPSKLF